MRNTVRVLAALFLLILAIFAASFSAGELVLLAAFGLGTFALAGKAEELLTRSMLVR